MVGATVCGRNDGAAVVEGRSMAIGIDAVCGGIAVDRMMLVGGKAVGCAVGEAAVGPSGMAVDETAARLIVMMKD